MSIKAGIKDLILSKIGKAGGNSTRGLKEVASDLVCNSDLKDGEIADMTGLSSATVKRIRELSPAKSGADYMPQADSLERVFRGMGAEISLKPVTIKKQFQNKEKDK